MLSRMTIGKKLGISFGALMLLVAGLAAAAWFTVNKLGEELDTAVNRTGPKLDYSNAVGRLIAQVAASNRAAMLGYVNQDHAFAEKQREALTGFRKILDERVKDIRPLLVTAEGVRALHSIEDSLAKYDAAISQYLALGKSGKFAEALAMMDATLAPLVSSMNQNVDVLVKQQRDFLKESVRSARTTTANSHWLIAIILSFTLAIGLVAAFVLRKVNATLRDAVGELRDGADQVASAAGQISASSQSLAQGASEQAAALEETSASSSEIRALARQNSENSRLAADLVSHSQQMFVETDRSLESMVAAMADIKGSSDKVAKIIKVIDEIAFQTNILALNAAVEAARAGEAGMGFAVVADEVRNLSQRCAQAAKDTAALIEESIAKSNGGKAKVDQVADSIQAITSEAAKVKTLVDDVSRGSQKQTRGIEDVARAMTAMEKVTQQSAASAEESAAAAEELTAQASTLAGVVEQLSEMVGPAAAGAKGPMGRTLSRAAR